MAKKKAWFDNKALIEYGNQLDELAGGSALKRAVAGSMTQSKVAINKEITATMSKSNLPAGGKYSTGETLRSLDKTTKVEWDGNVASLPLGFDFNKGGLTSVFLMHGTPTMAPVPGLYETVKGKKAQSIARAETKKAMKKVIERLGG